MPYKNKQITHSHMQQITRKVWRLFSRWEDTQLEVDYNLYLEYRETVARAIAAGPVAWTKEFRLP